VFISLTGVLSVVATLRLEIAIPLPKSDAESAAVAWCALWSAGLICGLLAVVGVVAAAPISSALGVPAMARLWWLVVLTVLLLAVVQVMSTWMVRQRQYQKLGVRNLAAGAAQTGGQLALGVVGLQPAGLLLAYSLGRLAGLGGLLSSGGLLRQPWPPKAGLVQVFGRYRRFPLIASSSALTNVAATHAPLLVISAFHGQAAVGLLGLAIRVLTAPSGLVGAAAAQVFQGEAAVFIRGSNPALRQAVLGTSKRLLLMGLGPSCLLLLCGPTLFGLVFGRGWTDAGVYAQLLAVGYLAQFSVSAVSQTLLLLERQVAQLRCDVMRLTAVLGGTVACLVLGASTRTTVAVLAAVYVVVYGYLFLVCVRAAGEFDKCAAVVRGECG
jgi:O-antigen/teichoic acid export membrane protein